MQKNRPAVFRVLKVRSKEATGTGLRGVGRAIVLVLLTLPPGPLFGAAEAPSLARSPTEDRVAISNEDSRSTRSRRSHRRALSALQAGRGCKPMHTSFGELIVEILVSQRYADLWWAGGLGGPTGGTSGGPEASPGPGDFTSTNNQEAGVDELDLVKTDGLTLYLAQEGRLDIVGAWPPQDSALLASLPLAGWSPGLFLDGDQVLVISSGPGVEIGPGSWAATRLDLVDVSDRAAPRGVRSLEIEGTVLGARKIGSRVFVVLSSFVSVPAEVWGFIWRSDLGLPDISRDATEEERQAAAAVARSILRPLVEDALAPLGVLDLLPLLRTAVPDGESRVEPLLGCRDLFRPDEPTTLSVLAVLSLDLETFGADGETESAGVLAEGFTTYASAHSLYIAQSSFWSWWGWGELDTETVIHRFDLGGGDGARTVRYAATGSVPGFLLDQFSMGEHEGYLRVATTEFDWWGVPLTENPGSRVTVLQDDGRGVLREIGHVAGIAPGEAIFASRFLGDKGYLVTFEQIDPLFTLDLSDPARPRVVGELKMPGFSTYLHPIGEDYLLAVGRAGQDDGTIEGVAINLFDVSDFAQPALAFQHVLDENEGWFGSEALHDHHAFTYHRGILSIPAYGWSHENGLFTGMLVFGADPQSGIRELGRIDHGSLGGEEARMRRSVYIDDAIYSISTRGVKVNDLFVPTLLYAEVPLP